MALKKKTVAFAALLSLPCFFLFGGCYTKLVSYQGETLMSSPRAPADCGDCEDVMRSSDRREVCVWERDIFGYPELRCYNTNHHSAWVYFHNTPWWYRDNFGWRNSRGCPPYYFYDRIAGICRYHTTYYPPPRPPNDAPGVGSDMVPERRNTRGRTAAPPPSPAESGPEFTIPSSSPMFGSGGGVRQFSPAPAPTPPPASGSQDGEQGRVPEESASQPSQPSQQSPPARERNDNEPPARRNTRGR